MITLTEAEWAQIQHHIAALSAQLAAAQQRIAELEAKKTPPPAFVKANTPTKPKSERQRRAPAHNRARRLETPTRVVEHPVTHCPQCQGHLSGIHLGRRRQVIEMPPPPPVEIIEHQVQRGWCSYCRKWREAPLDLSGQVIGHERFGTRLAAWITTMRMSLRLPIRLIQQWLATMHQVRVSVGGIIALLHRSAGHLQPVADQIRHRIRASPAVNGDETGWRENGHNGYVWAVGTPAGERYFERHASRSGAVINAILGEHFTGVLTTDFYAGYNDTPGGRHQRCWVHLLRDLHALKEVYPQRDDVLVWATAIRQVYEHAVVVRAAAASVRQQQREQGEQHLWDLAQQYAGEPSHPCRTLAKRLLRHHGELLVFLTAPGVDPDNNAAERQVRPLVVARKISGGSRSGRGSATHMICASLVATCQAKSLDVFHTLLRLFQSPLPQL